MVNSWLNEGWVEQLGFLPEKTMFSEMGGTVRLGTIGPSKDIRFFGILRQWWLYGQCRSRKYFTILYPLYYKIKALWKLTENIFGAGRNVYSIGYSIGCY